MFHAEDIQTKKHLMKRITNCCTLMKNNGIWLGRLYWISKFGERSMCKRFDFEQFLKWYWLKSNMVNPCAYLFILVCYFVHYYVPNLLNVSLFNACMKVPFPWWLSKVIFYSHEIFQCTWVYHIFQFLSEFKNSENIILGVSPLNNTSFWR